MALLELLLPPSCGGCARFGALLCAACRRSFRAAAEPVDRFFAPDAGVLVGGALELASSAFAYEGALRRALQRLKYGRVARLAGPLAEAAAPALVELHGTLAGAAAVPVPLHPARERERGYNQARLLAARLAELTAMSLSDVLVRRAPTVRQHKLDRAARARNLAGAIAVREATRVPGVAVIVDDIMTTGATLEACASVLMEAGAERVYGFTVAREI